jgi:hypothetical protein
MNDQPRKTYKSFFHGMSHLAARTAFVLEHKREPSPAELYAICKSRANAYFA